MPEKPPHKDDDDVSSGSETESESEEDEDTVRSYFVIPLRVLLPHAIVSPHHFSPKRIVNWNLRYGKKYFKIYLFMNYYKITYSPTYLLTLFMTLTLRDECATGINGESESTSLYD